MKMIGELDKNVIDALTPFSLDPFRLQHFQQFYCVERWRLMAAKNDGDDVVLHRFQVRLVEHRCCCMGLKGRLRIGGGWWREKRQRWRLMDWKKMEVLWLVLLRGERKSEGWEFFGCLSFMETEKGERRWGVQEGGERVQDRKMGVFGLSTEREERENGWEERENVRNKLGVMHHMLCAWWLGFYLIFLCYGLMHKMV